MVNHPNRRRTEPSHFLADAVRKTGETARLMWEIPGPKDTQIAWLSCYTICGWPCIVMTYKDGNGWEAFTPGAGNDLIATVQDVFNRCGVPVPA